MKIESPTVNLPNVRRTGLPPAHAAVFDLKAGDVSQVISDAGGHYIYKVNSKSQMPLDQAKNEIHSKLQNDRTREMMDKVNNSFKVDTNEAYLDPAGRHASAAAHAASRQVPLRLHRRRSRKRRLRRNLRRQNRTDGQTCRRRNRCFGQPGIQATAAAGELFGDRGGCQSTPNRIRDAV